MKYMEKERQREGGKQERKRGSNRRSTFRLLVYFSDCLQYLRLVQIKARSLDVLLGLLNLLLFFPSLLSGSWIAAEQLKIQLNILLVDIVNILIYSCAYLSFYVSLFL